MRTTVGTHLGVSCFYVAVKGHQKDNRTTLGVLLFLGQTHASKGGAFGGANIEGLPPLGVQWETLSQNTQWQPGINKPSNLARCWAAQK